MIIEIVHDISIPPFLVVLVSVRKTSDTGNVSVAKKPRDSYCLCCLGYHGYGIPV